MTTGTVFRCELNPRTPSSVVTDLTDALTLLARRGWRLSLREATGRPDPLGARVYWSSPYQAVDVFGVFEAPDTNAAHTGITELQTEGWDRLFNSTQWLVGPRDLDPDPGEGPHDDGFGFLALWDWNDPWHAASLSERAEYDSECDVAFRYDVSLGIDLFGRFACHAAAGWDHAALWEVPDLYTLTTAMGAHETQRDFMFTTSSHYIGRPIAFTQLEEHLT